MTRPDASDIGSSLIVRMQKTESRKHDCLGLAILLGVALAIGVYLIATSVLISKDGIFYIVQAQWLANDPLRAAGTYPIGYAFLLSAGHKVASLLADGDSTAVWIGSSQAVTLLCRLGALAFLYLLGRMLVGARRSFWAILILVVLPYPARYGSDVLREWPFLLFLAAGFWLLLWALRDGKWRLFALVGLIAGLGYLIRPMCGQLIVYGLLGLIVVACKQQQQRRWALPRAGLLLLMGFALPVMPYLVWTGKAVPHQLRLILSNTPPVITALGGKPAGDEPLSFAVRAGESFEAAIEASDPDGDAPSFSVVAIRPKARPVYRFHAPRQAADFWTISAGEKDWLLAYPYEVWHYKGIDFYAYAEAGATSGLEPVFRLWSPVLKRHFYTVLEAERTAMLEGVPGEQWHDEAVAFYAFPEGHEPSGAAAVYRFRDDAGRYVWTVEKAEAARTRLPGKHVRSDGIAWYGLAPGRLPAGMTLEGATLRWRPESQQQGLYRFNVIASDGQLQSCQLVHITVNGPHESQIGKGNGAPVETGPRGDLETIRDPVEARHTNQDGPNATGAPPAGYSRSVLGFLPSVGKILGGISESLMVYFFVPFCLGLYHRLRHAARPEERVLMIAAIVLNFGLILTRYMWIEFGSARRYSLGLVALTICYVPLGVEMMARWLRRALDRVFGDRGRPELGEKVWFYVLVTVGMAICIPKLLTPLGADKTGYRQTAEWLRSNTAAEDIIAVPDRRISFYAERQGRHYQGQAYPQETDYVVAFASDDGAGRRPEGWSERRSYWVNQRRKKRLVVYRMP